MTDLLSLFDVVVLTLINIFQFPFFVGSITFCVFAALVGLFKRFLRGY